MRYKTFALTKKACLSSLLLVVLKYKSCRESKLHPQGALMVENILDGDLSRLMKLNRDLTIQLAAYHTTSVLDSH